MVTDLNIFAELIRIHNIFRWIKTDNILHFLHLVIPERKQIALDVFFVYLIIAQLMWIQIYCRVHMAVMMKTWIMLLHYLYQRKIIGRRERLLVCITLPHPSFFCFLFEMNEVDSISSSWTSMFSLLVNHF
jgi:hypothetical protein